MWSAMNLENMDLDFVYEDTDTHANEMAELYCYTEEQEILNNQTAFEELMTLWNLPKTWSGQTASQQSRVIENLIDGMELVSESDRWKHIQSLFYLMQGTFGECDQIDECFKNARNNVMKVYAAGIFPALIQLLMWEIENSATAAAAQIVANAMSNQSSSQGPKKPGTVSLSDSYKIRLILSMMYTILEVMRVKSDDDTDREERLRHEFRSELNEPIVVNDANLSQQQPPQLLAIILFQMTNKFGNNTAPQFPIRKILLLLWKVLLVSLGGSDELLRLKNVYRNESGLPDSPDHTLDVVKTMRAASPPVNVNEVLEAQNQRKISKPLKRQMFVKQSSVVSGDESNDSDGGNGANDSLQEDEIILPDEGISEPEEASKSATSETASSSSESSDEKDIGGRPASPQRPDTPNSGSLLKKNDETDGNDEEVEETLSKIKKGLPWTPKIRPRDIDAFLDYTRQKFIGFKLMNDQTTTFGLPGPILESLSIMSKHVYVSLSEVQIKREEELMKYPLTVKEDHLLSMTSPTEKLYQAMLPTLSQCVISLLKILLAASPTSRSKSESMNIVADCLPEEMPSSVVASMKLGIDVNRHKEIIIKAISGIIILLLKHFKNNHVYQFEYICQQLMFANCIPLVLKFLNQNICQFVGSKNTISVIDFPVCVIGEQPELTTENLDLNEHHSVYCWRNMYSCINLLRILNKLTKWKHSRIMMLIVFKSAPILKKSLKLRHPMLQLYILKLLKIQAKYLGRQWRKSNMKTLSAIYQKVRHRLTDDWAFGNDIESRPWDFQAQEFSLQASINRFHHRRYAATHGSAHHHHHQNAGQNQNQQNMAESDALVDLDLLEEVDNNFLSVLSRHIDLPKQFTDNYETWMQREVFENQIDWDHLMMSTDSSCSI